MSTLHSINQSRLRDMLAAVRGARMLSFSALTRPEQKITPFGPVFKLTRVNAVTGARYAHAAAKQGLVSGEERAWGSREEPALVEKPNKDGTVSHYLPVQVNRVSRAMYLIAGPNGRLVAVPFSKVQPYLRPERPFSYKDYRLDHLISLAHENGRYRIRPEPITAL